MADRIKTPARRRSQPDRRRRSGQPSVVGGEGDDGECDRRRCAYRDGQWRDGGRELIQIVDDGCGMSPMDARMAFDRHATSKIASVEDIYALHTFGFRGEALASDRGRRAGRTAQHAAGEGDRWVRRRRSTAAKFQSQGAGDVSCGIAVLRAQPVFTTYRRDGGFWRRAPRLQKQIKAEFQRVALCNPAVAFELYDNDVPVYRLQPTSLAGRIVDVVGRHIKPNLLEVAGRHVDRSRRRVRGASGRGQKSNAEQYFFVNGRYFSDQYLRKGGAESL